MPSNSTASHSYPISVTPPSSTQDGESQGGPGGPLKRKRVPIACENCHNDKRRCDGTAPCSKCYYGQKTCVYRDKYGNTLEPPMKPHEALQGIIENVDLSRSPDVLLTYRTGATASTSSGASLP